MVVYEDQCRRAEIECARHDFAGIDRRVIDSAFLQDFICHDPVFLVEEEHAELFSL